MTEDGSRRAESGDRRKRSAKGMAARVRDLWMRALERRWLWAALLVVVGSWALAPEGLLLRRGVETGQIAARDYQARRDLLVPDEETTAEKRRQAEESVLPIYDFDQAKAESYERAISRLFEAGRTQRAQADEGEDPSSIDAAVVEALGADTGVLPRHVGILRARGFSPEDEERLRALGRAALERGVVASKPLLLENRIRGVTMRSLKSGTDWQEVDLFRYLGYPDEVRQYLAAEVGGWVGWSRGVRSEVVDLVLANLQPNVSFNLGETRDRRRQAAEAVEPVFRQIRRGQVVARRGDALSEEAVRAIREMGGGRLRWSQYLPMVGNLLLLALAALALAQGLSRAPLAKDYDARTFGGVVLLLIGGLVTLRAGLVVCSALANQFSSLPFDAETGLRYALPFAALPLVTSLFFGRGAALLMCVVFAALMGRQVPGDAFSVVLFVLIGSLAGIYYLDRLSRRVAITRAGFLVGGVGIVATLMISSFGTTWPPIQRIGFEMATALAGGILVAATTSFLVPILEALLAKTTDIRLLELSDTNLPLMQRLAFEAPGSFQHSLMVANLAKAGSEAIGANSILAYTSGLYHDIGKLVRPQYFVENQHGENPHDKLAPTMSSLIVIQHVKEGLELGEDFGLPQVVLDGIAQHHGTRRLEFFYNRAQSQAKGAVDEGKFRYPGPRPQNKVNGILMLADAIEAASRTLRTPSPATIRNLLQRLFDECLEDDQLAETDLTLSDLRRIREAFTRVLQTIHHRRIDYPGFDFEDQSGQHLRVVGGTGDRRADRT